MSATSPAPPARGASSRIAEAVLVSHLRSTIDQLQSVIETQQTELSTLKSTLSESSKHNPTPIHLPDAVADLVATLRNLVKCSNVDNERFITSLQSLERFDTFLKQETATQKEKLAHIQKFIADTELAWQGHSTSAHNDLDQLRQVAWTGWPVVNQVDPANYHYDFFISYRVSSESNLARELKLQLVSLGFRVFLDQEELKDGEDWRKGFVLGLKRSRIVLMLVSEGCVRRMMTSNRGVDNVLLEWETAMCAQEMGFCLAVPVYIGTGKVDFSQFPKERAIIGDSSDSENICRQSAYSTLSKLNALPDPIFFPVPTKGLDQATINQIAGELVAFDELHRNCALQRAQVIFSNMRSLEIFYDGKDFEVVKFWTSEKVSVSNVSSKYLSSVKFLIEQNPYWKKFRFQGQTNIDNLSILLQSTMLKDPSRITFDRKWLDGDFQRAKVALRECKSIDTIKFNSCELCPDLIELCKSLPNLKSIGLFECTFDMDEIEGDVKDFCDLLKSVKDLDTVNIWHSPKLDTKKEKQNAALVDKCSDMILQTLTDSKLKKLDYTDSRITQNGLLSIESMLCRTLTLKSLDLTGQEISDDMIKCFQRGFSVNKTVTVIALEDITSTLNNLILIFSSIKALAIEEISVSGEVSTGEDVHDSLVEIYSDFLKNHKTLKTFQFLRIANLPEVANNRSITRLNVSDTAMALDDEFSSQLNGMTQLETIEFYEFYLKNKTPEAFFKSLFSCKSLKKIDLSDISLNEECGSAIASSLNLSATLEELIISTQKLRSIDTLDIVRAAAKCGSLKLLKLQAYNCRNDSFAVIKEAMTINSDLDIIVDWYDDIDAYAKSNYILPRLHKKSSIDIFSIRRRQAPKPILEFSDERIALISPAKVPNQQSIERSIMNQASQLQNLEASISTSSAIQNAIEKIRPFFKRSSTPSKSMGWQIELSQAMPSVVLLDSILAGSLENSYEDCVIIRELQLRLKTLQLASSESWAKYQDTDPFKPQSSKTSKKLPAAPSKSRKRKVKEAGGDGLFTYKDSFLSDQSLQFSVQNSRYPVQTLAVAKPNYIPILPSIVVLLLSESIFDNLENDETKFWAAINAWEYLMQCADDEKLTVIPGEIIWKLKTKFCHALYLLASKRVSRDGRFNSAGEGDGDIARAFDIIELLFKLQGITIEKVQQSQATASKIFDVLKSFLRKKEKEQNAIAKASRDFEEVLSKGLQDQTFNLKVDIVDDNIHAVGPLLQAMKAKHFVGVTGMDSLTTNIEEYIVEAWKKAPFLETINLNGYKSGDSRACTDKAWIQFAKDLRRMALTKITLKWNMATEKAAEILCESLASHTTLKHLELNGFAHFYTKPLCTHLLKNTTLTTLILTGQRHYFWNNKFEFWKQDIPQEGITALCKLIDENKTITSLTLKHISFDPSSAKRVATATSRNVYLKSLNFWGCSVTTTILLTELKCNTYLKSLDLSYLAYDETVFALIAEWLETNNSYQKFQNNVVKFFRSVTRNQSLAFLNLNGLDLKNKDIAEAFLTFVTNNYSISKLSLDGCNMHDDVGCKFIKIIANRRQYEHLILSDNYLDTPTWEEIAEWVKRDDGKLLTLSVSGNYELYAKTKTLLTDAVSRNRTISTFDFDYVKEARHRLESNLRRQATKCDKEAFEFAIKHNDEYVLKQLQNLPDSTDFTTTHREWLFFISIRHGNLAMLRSLMSSNQGLLDMTFEGNLLTPVGVAIKYDQAECLRYLVNSRVSLVAAKPYSRTIPAFYFAAGICGNDKLAEIIRPSIPMRLDEMVDERVTEKLERRGFTALHRAALNGYHVAVVYLLKHIKHPGTPDSFGSTPLHCAARLLKHPGGITGKVNAPTKETKDSKDKADDSDSGSDYDDDDDDEDDKSDSGNGKHKAEGDQPKLADDEEGKKNATEEGEQSIFEAEVNHIKTIKALIACGKINIKAKDKLGRTALDLAKLTGNQDAIAAFTTT
ncbi:hypothetical protein HDU97_007042 [Phlyctochytrium planicorne]|nr:hypothetical protein HDU97_007042 [Phlyctochytrium planicorne]